MLSASDNAHRTTPRPLSPSAATARSGPLRLSAQPLHAACRRAAVTACAFAGLHPDESAVASWRCSCDRFGGRALGALANARSCKLLPVRSCLARYSNETRALRLPGPNTLREAIDLLASNPEAVVIAGGQSLMPVLAFRLAAPSLLVDQTFIAICHDLASLTSVPPACPLGPLGNM
jgi:FAD binding domain in molybdopterin dehydrogenase